MSKIDFEKTFEKIFKETDRSIGVFIGNLANDGKNWCPDCEDAKPTIEAFLKPQSVQLCIKLTEFRVGNREE